MFKGYDTVIHKTKSYFELSVWIIPISLAVLLIFLSNINFLLFHTLAEFFAISIGILSFVVAWQMYPFSQNNFLMYLGCGYFWIAILDMAHSLSYKGLYLLPNSVADTSIQFWIGTRFLEALLLLTAPFYLKYSFDRIKVVVLFGVIAISFILLIVITDIFPRMFFEGIGLTRLKVNSEYFIITLLFLSIIHLYKNKKLIERRIVDVMIVAVLFTVCAEMAFTFYVDIYGLSNLIGHIFKLFSFWLIYLAIVRTTLKEPFLMMSKRATSYDAIPDATVIVDKNGIIRQANYKASLLANVPINELIGKTSHAVFHADMNQESCYVCQAILKNKELEQFEMDVDDQGTSYDFSLSPITNKGDIQGAVEVIRNISERKRAEKNFRELSVLKNSIVDNLPNIVFVKDAKDHRFLEFNKAGEELTGMNKEEMLGKNDYDFWPKEQAQFFIDKDAEVISSGKLLDIPEEPITTKVKGVRTLHTKKIPIYDENGVPRYLLGISDDITEKLKTDEMLRRSQKLDAIGRMSGGIAHDFNNQLGVITGYLELLNGKNIDEKTTKWLTAMSDATERCIDLTRQLLIFSKGDLVDTKIVNVNEIITGMNTMVERLLTPEVELTYNLAKQLWNTQLNIGSLQDAIINLAINARDAMPNEGSLIFETSNISLNSDSPLVISEELRPGDYVLIKVSDSGHGMTKDVIDRIFEPFFTTKAVDKGTGLGLSMVYGFINRSGGAVDVESELNKGSSFYLYLPRSTMVLDKIELDTQKEPQQGTESILIVDDEPSLLSLAEHNLSEFGYNTFTANDGSDALVILNKGKVIDLLFTDLVMPGGMSGYELAKAALKINPNLKVLITSGHSEKAVNSNDVKESGFNLLKKPYRRDELLEMIRKLLDKS